MSRDISPFGLRMPHVLKDKVESAAKSNGRSINAEIVQRLENSFTGSGLSKTDLFDFETLVEELGQERAEKLFNRMAEMMESVVRSTRMEKELEELRRLK